jgi:hypothetical protein
MNALLKNTAMRWVSLLALFHISAAVRAEPLRSLHVEPQRVLLHGHSRQQQLLVTGHTPDGRALDVTRLCEIVSSDPEIATVSGGVVRGVRDGTAEVRIRAGELGVSVPVRVRDSAVSPPVHFDIDLVPIFSKLGCNAGGCHGKASGQYGFRLSSALIPQPTTTRPSGLAVVARSCLCSDQSLILLKPTGRVPHGGGRRIELHSLDHVSARWVQGMPFGTADAPRLVEPRSLASASSG